MSGAEKRQFLEGSLTNKTYLNKRYVYRIEGTPHNKTLPPMSYGLEYSDNVLKGVRELSIGQSRPPSHVIPSLIIHRIKNPGEPYDHRDEIEAVWQGFDGRKSKLFDAKMFTAYAFGKDGHSGRIFAQPSLSLLTSDPVFQIIYPDIGYRCLGASDLKIDYEQLMQGMDIFEIEHPKFGKCYEKKPFGNSDPGFKSVLTGAPEYLQLKFYLTDRYQSEVIESKVINGIRYPARGKCSDMNAEWSFELISVEAIEPTKNADDWFPQWPTGTTVSDTLQNKLVKHPFTPEQRQAVNGFLLKQSLLAGTPAAKWTPLFILNMFLVSVIGTLMIWQIVRKFRAQS